MLGLGIAAAGLSSLSIPMSTGVSELVIVVIADCWGVTDSLALMGMNEDMGQTCRTEPQMIFKY